MKLIRPSAITLPIGFVARVYDADGSDSNNTGKLSSLRFLYARDSKKSVSLCGELIQFTCIDYTPLRNMKPIIM